MSTEPKNGLATRLPHDVQLGTELTAKAVEGFVTTGDISRLSPAERTRYYLGLCAQLGLNPATQPLASLKLNGKEILYPTRGATDQLAAVHGLTREVVEGPEVRKLGSTEIVYCKVKVTHPNGRTETAIATLVFKDPAMDLMKAETKAKRRATLSILGLGWLDEMEVESIPSAAKAPARPIEVTTGALETELMEALATCPDMDAYHAIRDRILKVDPSMKTPFFKRLGDAARATRARLESQGAA